MTARAGTFIQTSVRCLLLAVLACGGGAATGPSEISPQAVLASGGEANAPLVLDVRSPDEFASGRVPGAVNLPHEQVAARLGELDRAREIVEFDAAWQPVATARQALDLDAELAQFTDEFPDGGPTDLHLGRERRARMQRAVREQAEQHLGPALHRGRSSQSRRARFSTPARIRSMFERCV